MRLLLLLALVACAADKKPAAPPPLPAASEGVTVLDPGKAPLAQLAYHPGQGDTFAINLTVGQRMIAGGPTGNAQALSDTSLPAITVVFNATVVAAPREGGFTAELKVAGVVVGDGELAESVRSETAPLAGATGTLVANPRGTKVDVRLVVPDTTSPTQSLASLLKSLETTLGSMVLPLPDAEVGAGARWAFDDQSEVFGTGAVPVKVHAEVTLDRVEGSALSVHLALTHTTAASSAPVAGVQEIKIDSFQGAGTRVGRYDLTALGAVHLDSVSRYRITGTVPQTGSQLAVDLTTKVGFEVQ